MDRTTTVLFAVLIPPVGSGGTEAGRVPGICLLPEVGGNVKGTVRVDLGPPEGRGSREWWELG